MKFDRHDIVLHVNSGNEYVILFTPAHGIRIEATAELAYVYQERESQTIWVRGAERMEDGRFTLVAKTKDAARGLLTSLLT